MSGLEFWVIYLGGLLLVLVPLGLSFWVMERLLKRLGKEVIKFIRDTWKEQ